MEVKCIKSTRKLICGITYIADSFSNDLLNSNKWVFGRIDIKGYGMHNISNFSDLSGNPLPSINYQNKQKVKIEWEFPDLKKGDIVICKSDRYKYFLRDQKYRVSDIHIIPRSGTRNGESLIKFEGYNKWIKWNPWTFEKLSLQDSRELAIHQIFDKPENFSVEFVSKFEQMHREKALMECVSRAILDKGRHHYSILEWAVEKSSKGIGVTLGDFDNILQKPLSEILKLIEQDS